MQLNLASINLKTNTTAVLPTFNLSDTPYNIYIPGESADITAACKCQHQNKCYRYGYTKNDSEKNKFAVTGATA